MEISQLSPLMDYLTGLKQAAEPNALQAQMAKLTVQAQDVLSACQFSDEHYTRTLVSSSEWYELLLICWQPQQTSMVHDHHGSECVYRVIQGTASEISASATTGNFVKPVEIITCSSNEVSSVSHADIHQVYNDSTEENLVTLHAYSPPLCMSSYQWDPAYHHQLPDTVRTKLGN